MRISRPNAPWRMDDDGKGKDDQDAEAHPQSETESLAGWCPPLRDSIKLADFRGAPLTPQVLEEAMRIVKRDYGSTPPNYIIKGRIFKPEELQDLFERSERGEHVDLFTEDDQLPKAGN